MKLNRLSILYGLVVMLVGCGKSDPESTKETTAAFLAASSSGNRAAWTGYMTKAAREKMETPEGKNVKISQQSATGYTVGTPVISGTAAEVPVNSQDKQGKPVEALVKLTKEDGNWKVWAMTFMTPFQVTVDFEHPETVGGEMIKAMGQKQ